LQQLRIESSSLQQTGDEQTMLQVSLMGSQSDDASDKRDF